MIKETSNDALTHGGRESLRDELLMATHGLDGSRSHAKARRLELQKFANFLQSHGYEVSNIDSIRTRHVRRYLNFLKSNGLAESTIANSLSFIRTTIARTGRVMFANQSLNAEALGLKHAPAIHAVPYQQYADAIRQLQQLNAGVAAAVALSRWLGLSAKEAVMSWTSLPNWVAVLTLAQERAVESNAVGQEFGHLTQLSVEQSTLLIHVGTKGSRSRRVPVSMLPSLDEALAAVVAAQTIAGMQNGNLVDAPSIKLALRILAETLYTVDLDLERVRAAWVMEVMKRYTASHRPGIESERRARRLASALAGRGDKKAPWTAPESFNHVT